MVGYGLFVPTGEYAFFGYDNAGLGIVHYGQFKVSSDKAGALTPLFQGRQDRVFAVGLESNVYLAKSKLFLGLRFLPEFEARNRTEGLTFILTFAREIRSFARPPAR